VDNPPDSLQDGQSVRRAKEPQGKS
jgi:hypothetical protein